MTEKIISKKLREVFPRVSGGGMAYTFEACSVFSVPDLYIVAPARVPFWLELKVAQSSSSKIPFRHGQPAWIDMHSKAGGQTNVLVYSEMDQEILCFAGHKVRSLAKRKLCEAEDWLLWRLFFSPSRANRWELLAKSLLHSPTHK